MRILSEGDNILQSNMTTVHHLVCAQCGIDMCPLQNKIYSKSKNNFCYNRSKYEYTYFVSFH